MNHLFLLVDEISLDVTSFRNTYKSLILYDLAFNKLFDLLQVMMRHHSCPQSFIVKCSEIFRTCRLAYAVDTTHPATIVPAATDAEGQAVVDALRQLRRSGLTGAVTHLRQASQAINQRDWPGSIRESIHAVESVARQMDPKSSTSLGPALKSLERQGDLHPALKEAFSKLYGYTSDEEGIRHALLDTDQSRPQLDEAVFMLGACSAFASYLSRKHEASK